MQLSRLCLTLLVGSGLAFQLVPAAAEVVLGSSASTFLEGSSRPDNEAINRGRAALRTRNLEQAEKHFSEAYRQNPASVEAMLGLAVVSHSQGKAKLAGAFGRLEHQPGIEGDGRGQRRWQSPPLFQHREPAPGSPGATAVTT